MQKQHRMRKSLLATVGLLAGLFLVAPAADAASVTPTFYEGNLTCEDFGYTTINKFDPPNAGSAAGITLIRNAGSSISWTSTVPVDAVMVKGGPNGNIYEYPNDTFSDSNLVPPTNPSNGEPYGLSHVNFCTNNTPEPPPEGPAIDVQKVADSDVTYPGNTVVFTIVATNTGDVPLSDPTIADSECTDQGGVLAEVDVPDPLVPGDTALWTCTVKVPDNHAVGGAAISNTAEVCATPPGEGAEDVCDEGGDTVPVLHPEIDVVKLAVATPIPAGTTAKFTIKVTNTGDTELTGYTVADTKCPSNLVQTSGPTDDSMSVGEVREYTCDVPTAATDTADVVNEVTATGHSGPVTRTDTAAATVQLTAPGTTPPPGGGETPGGGVLPEENLSGRARLRGPSGCVKTAFRARVTGRSIASVSFFVDGKLVKKITGARTTYSVKIRPSALGFGRHKVVAKVTFTAASGTKSRRLPLTFQRCARQSVAPRFTG